MQYILLTFIHSYILVTIFLISYQLLNRLVKLYNSTMRKSTLATVPTINFNQQFIYQPNLFNTKPYEAITHHSFHPSSNRQYSDTEYHVDTNVSETVQLEIDYSSTEEELPFTETNPYSIIVLNTMTVKELRDVCNQLSIKWRNANGKNKHLTKQQIISRIALMPTYQL